MFKFWPTFILGLVVGYLLSFLTLSQLILGIVYVVIVIIIIFLGFFLITYSQLHFAESVISDIKSIRFTNIGNNEYEARIESLDFYHITVNESMKHILNNAKKHEVAYFYNKFDDFVLKKSIIDQMKLTFAFMPMYLHDLLKK